MIDDVKHTPPDNLRIGWSMGDEDTMPSHILAYTPIANFGTDRVATIYLRSTPLRDAAPDMLEALIKSRGFIIDLGFPSNGRMVTTINAAIAKATGGV